MRRYAVPIPDRREAPRDILPSSAPHPIFARLIEEVAPRTIVEVGACQGGATVHMASLTDATIITMDRWHDQAGIECREVFVREVGARKLGDRVIALHMLSVAAADLAKVNGVRPELVYLDGAHDEASVTADIRAWLPLIPPGGVLFGHDFNMGGVRSAVKACLGDVESEGVFWIWRVKP